MEIKEIINQLESADSYHRQEEYHLTDEAIEAAVALLKTLDVKDLKPLTLEELMNRNKPVFVPSERDGFYCLCRNGVIVPPSGMAFDAKDRPSWTFYDSPPQI